MNTFIGGKNAANHLAQSQSDRMAALAAQHIVLRSC